MPPWPGPSQPPSTGSNCWLSLFPFDRLPSRLLQLQHVQQTIAVEKRYNGIADCFVRVVREQGPLSLWRGNGVNVARIFPQQAMNFAFKVGRSLDNLKWFRIRIKNISSREWTRRNSSSVILPAIWPPEDWPGLRASSSSIPWVGSHDSYKRDSDFSRTRLAVDIGKEAANREFTGFFDCTR